MVPNFGQTEPQLAMASAEVTKCVCTTNGYKTLTIPGFY